MQLLLDDRRDLSPVRGVDEPQNDAPDQTDDHAPQAAPAALLGVPELAELLTVDAATVRRWRRENRLPPALVVGKTVRWRPEDIEAWIAENREAAR